jgi:hypothetical protein
MALSSAFIRGFFIFLLLIAGQLVIAGTIDLDNPSEVGIPQYFRLFATASLLSFVIGYRPDTVLNFIEKLSNRTGSSTNHEKSPLEETQPKN